MSFLSHSSGDLIADRRYAFGQDLAARGDYAAAADLFTQAIEAAPGFAAAWFSLAEAKERLGHSAEAAAAFRQAVAADPQDHQGAQLRLIRLGVEPIGDMPLTYIRDVFDQYAARFDAALTLGLAYKGPALLRDAVRRACEASGRGFHFSAMLDLGCGTGLAGAAFRDAVDELAGVDVSPNMIAQARARGIYDRLAARDIMQHLAEQSPQRFDIVVAADVFAYFMDLRTVLAAITSVLSVGGLTAFTVETHDGQGIVLGEKLRYAHSAAHVHAAIAEAGLDVVVLEDASTRNEAGMPVPGLLAVAQRRR
jgi:predicted TPR repeat methyltransferase